MQSSKHFQLVQKNPSGALIYPKVKYTQKQSQSKVIELKLSLHRSNELLLLRSLSTDSLLSAISIPFSDIHSVSFKQEGIFRKTRFCLIKTRLTDIILEMAQAQELFLFLTERMAKSSRIQSKSFKECLQREEQKLKQKEGLAQSCFKNYKAFKTNLDNFKSLIQSIKSDKSITDKQFEAIFAKISIVNRFQNYTTSELTQVIKQAAKEFSARNGGVANLMDIFFCVNKVKKAGFVSPKQVQKVCSGLQQFKLITLKDGHKILQDKKVSEFNLLALMPDQKGFTLQELTQLSRMSLLSVRVKVSQLEDQGSICRDDRICGVKFFRNIYL